MACALTLWMFLRETGPRAKRELARA